MRIDTFDLSTDRTKLPEQSQVARSGGIARVQVIRCDSPASILVDGPSATPIPAVPGLILENFTTLYVSNHAAGGALVLAFYECQPGSPASFPFARTLARDSGGAQFTLEVVPPGPDWSIVVSGLTVAMEGTVGADDRAVLREKFRDSFTIEILYERPLQDNGAVDIEFHKPLVLPAGFNARLSTPQVASGNVYAAIRGFIIQ